MTVIATFAPSYGSAQTVTPGVASASITIGRGSKSMCMTNLGATPCYFRTSSGASTATIADYVLPAGAQVSISKFQDQDTVSFITASGSTSLHIIPGEGF